MSLARVVARDGGVMKVPIVTMVSVLRRTSSAAISR